MSEPKTWIMHRILNLGHDPSKMGRAGARKRRKQKRERERKRWWIKAARRHTQEQIDAVQRQCGD